MSEVQALDFPMECDMFDQFRIFQHVFFFIEFVQYVFIEFVQYVVRLLVVQQFDEFNQHVVVFGKQSIFVIVEFNQFVEPIEPV